MILLIQATLMVVCNLGRKHEVYYYKWNNMLIIPSLKDTLDPPLASSHSLHYDPIRCKTLLIFHP